jgi:GDP-4-dehydro-6-deoxy-D-mannose reductase
VKRVLVTGSSGFVGQVLSEVMGVDGLEVLGVDRRESTAGRFARTYAVDLCDQQAVEALLGDVRPDYIVHLAAQSSASRSFVEPHATIRTNVLPVLHMLEYLRTNTGTRTRLLAVGSAEVYGPVDDPSLPLVESRLPNPRSPYALSKLLQEQCCSQYASLYDVDLVMTRSFNHTGAGQTDTFVLSSFARQITEIKAGTRDATVRVGNIDVRRDFTDVRDVCRAYTLLLEKGRRGKIYNVCSGVSHSLRELLEKLAEIAGIGIKIEVDKSRLRAVDIAELYGDNSRLATDTGWQPEIPVEDTLAALLHYWSQNLEQ